MFEIRGKTAVVTGSGRGIGRDIAVQLARLGARVVVNVKKRQEDGKETLNMVLGYSDGILVQADVSRRDGARTLVRETLDAFGQVHILVNNAGLGIGAPFLDADDALIDKMVSTNLMSAVYCSQEFARVMQPGGCIVMMASMAGVRPMSMLSLYGISKAAVIKLAEYLALELAPKRIRVNAVAPSVVRTKMGESLIEFLGLDDEEYGMKHTLTGRMITVEEVTDAVLFLIRSESITGHTLMIDSGQALMSELSLARLGAGQE